MSDKITRLANRSGDTAALDHLWREWFRLQNATGRTDEQVDADSDRSVEIEKLMARTPATDLAHVEIKLHVYADGAFGKPGDAHPLIASVMTDLSELANVWDTALGDLTPAKLVQIADMAEDLQCHLDTYARAAGALGEALGDRDDAGADASIAYAVSNSLRSLHREATDLVKALYEAKSAAKSAAA